MAVVALAAFKGVAEGVEYIAENGIAVTMASDSLYNSDSVMAMCEATLTSPVNVPNTTTYAIKPLSAPVMAMIAAMALLLPLKPPSVRRGIKYYSHSTLFGNAVRLM